MPEALRVSNAYSEFGFRLRPEVVDVNRLFIDDCSTANGPADKRLFRTEPRLNRSIVGYESEYISLDESNHRIVGTAYTRGSLCDYIEHRLNICRRTGNDAQNLARRRLLFQRFSEFLKQADVFDRNHSLISEGCHQLDLPFGKWRDRFAPDGNRPNWNPLAEHGYSKESA